MSRFYYYLCAQLPLLTREGKSPIAAGALDELAKQGLNKEDYNKFSRCKLVPDWENFTATGTVYDQYFVWEKALRAAIARVRCTPGSEAADAIPEAESFSEINAMINTALGQTPAERELTVNRLRWEKLDELAFNREFTLDFLCAYKLKNEILLKLQNRTQEAGKKIFERLVGAAGEF